MTESEEENGGKERSEKFSNPCDTKVSALAWIVTGGYLWIKVYLCVALFDARDHRRKGEKIDSPW